MDLSSPQAAQRLGVSRQRILALISEGVVPARRVGGRWLIREIDVEKRERSRPYGKPMAPVTAWGLIALLDGKSAPWLRADRRSRLRARLRAHPPVELVQAWVRKRSEVLHFKAHPSALRRLLSYPGALPAGVSARGHDLVDPARTEVYLRSGTVADAVRSLVLSPAEPGNGNAVIRVPRDLWPFEAELGAATLAFDLWEAGDERSRRTAARIYRRRLEEEFPVPESEHGE